MTSCQIFDNGINLDTLSKIEKINKKILNFLSTMFYDVFDYMKFFDNILERDHELLSELDFSRGKLASSSKDKVTSRENYVYKEYKDGNLVSERNVEWENGRKIKDITSAPKIEGEGNEKPMGLPTKENCNLSAEEKNMLETTNKADWKTFRKDINEKATQDGKYKVINELGEKVADTIKKGNKTDSDRLAELEKKVEELSKQNKELLEKNADYVVKFAKIKNLF